ncbi:unnamed protein product [Lupinus luteus]|uniref:Uncharacterized protein n=1 Tax=Lupinus luteus TaxID=3873 RepID=A0AAV1XLX0_LUPLU
MTNKFDKLTEEDVPGRNKGFAITMNLSKDNLSTKTEHTHLDKDMRTNQATYQDRTREKEAHELVINLEIDKDAEFQLQNLEKVHQSPIARDSEVEQVMEDIISPRENNQMGFEQVHDSNDNVIIQETTDFDQVAASDIRIVGRLWGDDELNEPEEEFTIVFVQVLEEKNEKKRSI